MGLVMQSLQNAVECKTFVFQQESGKKAVSPVFGNMPVIEKVADILAIGIGDRQFALQERFDQGRLSGLERVAFAAEPMIRENAHKARVALEPFRHLTAGILICQELLQRLPKPLMPRAGGILANPPYFIVVND